MSKFHVMTDIETMGVGSNSPIIAIGAVSFDINAEPGTFDELFYERVNLDSNLKAGRQVRADTVAWWFRQNDNARHEAADAIERGMDLDKALQSFRVFFDVVVSKGQIDGVWSHGASFDLPILEDAYAANGDTAPWPFWADRCSRTLAALTDARSVSVDRPRPTTAHDALEDSKAQAEWVQRMWQSLSR